MVLALHQVAAGYGQERILNDISFELATGEMTCLLGPNGSGKSTLFKAILKLISLQDGDISIQGENISYWHHGRLARFIGYIPQAHVPPFPYRALDVVLMGRTSHMGIFSNPREKDAAVAEQAMTTLNIDHLKEKTYTEMSGGERQLVLIARALAQEPHILITDEPTNSLDFGNQLLVLEKMRRLANAGMTIFMASHFPEHALLYADKVILLKDGMIIGMGPPKETLTVEQIYNLYGVKVRMVEASTADGSRVHLCVPQKVFTH